VEEISSWNVMKIYVEQVDDVNIRVFSEWGIEQELSAFFTFEVPGAKFTPKYKARLWDGKIRLYNLQRKTLLAGLYNYVKEFANRNGYQFIDAPNTSYKKLPVNDYTYEEVENFAEDLQLSARGEPIDIRDYQIEAIQKGMNEHRCLLLSPTASGKSLILYTLMRHYVGEGKKCILIVPTTSLVEQMYADFEEYSSVNLWRVSKNCQKLYSGFTKDITSPVLITTWQSIYKQPKAWFDQFDVCFGDEAHQFKAASLNTVMEKMTSIPYRIGTTGTLDGKQVHRLVLEGMFGPVHRVTTTKALMDTNRVAQLNITCLLLKYDEETRKARKNNLYQDEMDFLVKNSKRNRFIVNLAKSLKGNTLVLFQYVDKHGKVLYDMCKDFPDREVHIVHGDIKVDERESIRHKAAKHDNMLVFASYGTFSTGVNMPSIENVIFASPSKSKIRNLQSIGRGLRLNEGKTHCNLYDIADDLTHKAWKNHTLGHFMERVKLYSEEQFKSKIVEVDL
jgi:superfamily II DNA or RNA helicase